MQRLFLYKLLPKPPQNLSTPSSNPSLFPSPKTQSHNPHHFFTHYTTFSHSKNKIITQPNNLPNGILSNSIIAKHFLKNIHSNFQNSGVSGTLYGSVKALFSRRSFHSLNSYGGGWSGKALFSRRSFQSLNSYGGGWRSGYHWLTSDNVILALIISNVAVFMLWRVADRQFMIKNFMISVDNLRNGRIHTLITHAFSHIDTFHLISNMLGLYFFGTSIGRNFGPTYLLKLYLAGAVVGAVFHLVHHALKSPSIRGYDSPVLGASGAVNAIMLLEIFLFPRNTIYLEFFIPMPAFVLGILIIGKDVWRIWKGDSRISGGSHLGGATVAAVAWALVRRRIY